MTLLAAMHRYVLALDVAGFIETFAEARQIPHVRRAFHLSVFVGARVVFAIIWRF